MQAVGQVIQNIFPNKTRKVLFKWRLNKIGSLALLIIIWSTFDQAFKTGAFTSVRPDNIVFIVSISVAFYSVDAHLRSHVNTLAQQTTHDRGSLLRPCQDSCNGSTTLNCHVSGTCYDYRIEDSDSYGDLPSLADCRR